MSDRRNLNLARITRNPTSGYQPTGHAGLAAAAYLLQGEPWFTWDQVPFMVRDNAVAMGLRALRSPFPKIKIAKNEQGQLKVSTKDPRIKRYVVKTWSKFWKSSLLRLLNNYFKWGRAPGGAFVGCGTSPAFNVWTPPAAGLGTSAGGSSPVDKWPGTSAPDRP